MSSSESVGIGSQFMDSLKGIITGIVLFPVSILIIYNVETCTQAGDAFKKAKAADQVQAGEPAYITGKFSASPISSSFVKQGNYIQISQSSEVYAWDEEEKTKGEGTSKEKVRECKLKWTSSPENPDTFKLPACKNKYYYKRSVASDTINAENGRLTANGKSYNLNLDGIDYTSAVGGRNAQKDELNIYGYTYGEDYLYNRTGCTPTPEPGCERISVRVTPIPTGDMTFLGSLSGDSLSSYMYKDKKFMSAGIGGYEETMKQIKSDDAMQTWIGRFIGFIAMWASFALLVGPITLVLDFIPFIGGLGKSAINFVLGAIAFVITTITILLIKLWFVWLLLIMGAIGYGFYKKKQAKAATTSA